MPDTIYSDRMSAALVAQDSPAAAELYRGLSVWMALGQKGSLRSRNPRQCSLELCATGDF